MKKIEKKEQACNLKDILEIKNATENSVDLYIYGDITGHEYDETNVTPQAIKDFLNKANGRNINVYINSGGGSVFAGNAIASMLTRYEGKVVATIDGLCASIATAIFHAADEKCISENGIYMEHQSWAPLSTHGNKEELRSYSEKICTVLDVIDRTLLDMYESNLRDGVSFEKVRKNFESGEDIWYTSQEVVETYNVEKLDTSVTAYASSSFVEIPEKIKAKLGINDNESINEHKEKLQVIAWEFE